MAAIIQASIISKDYSEFAAKISNGGRGQNVQNQPTVKWRPPSSEVIKINTDASFNAQSNIASCAGIIARDCQGRIMFGITKRFPATSPLLAEALALCEAVAVASSFGVSRVLFENVNLNLINTCRGEDKWGEIQAVVHDISSMKAQFQKVGFTWVARKGNEVANHLAHLAMANRLPLHWRWCTPKSLQVLLEADKPRDSSA